jgi:ribose/xylose/arabinose/galactoside ABC-type transport system permease subunit
VANPFDLVGSERSVIAAVVLGGTRIIGACKPAAPQRTDPGTESGGDC